MTDIRIKTDQSLRGTQMDWVRTMSGLSEDEELATAVRLALGTDARALDSDILPDLDSTDKRGWWGDFEAEEIWKGWPIGCKNWLLLRSKITDANSVEGSTVVRAEIYTREALQPFIDKQIATKIDVQARRVGRQQIDVHVTVYRGPAQAVDLRFAFLWDQVVVS